MGLVAREIESRGVATAVHSWYPEYPVGVGAPRVVGIGYPGSVPFGLPGDAGSQRAVLRAALEAAFEMRQPGQRIDLDFDWPARTRVPRPPKAPPIARAIMQRPWLLLKLINGDVPRSEPPADAAPYE